MFLSLLNFFRSLHACNACVTYVIVGLNFLLNYFQINLLPLPSFNLKFNLTLFNLLKFKFKTIFLIHELVNKMLLEFNLLKSFYLI